MSAEDYPSAEQQREWREKKAYFDKKKWDGIKKQFGLRELGWNGGLVHWEGRGLEGWYGIKNKVYRLKGTTKWKPGLLRDLKKLFNMPQDNKLDAIRQMGAKAFSEAMGAGSQKQAIDNAVLHSITYTPIHKYIGWVLPLMEVRAKITEQLYGYKPGEVKTQMLLGELESINNLIKERLDITGIENYLKEIQ